MGKTRNLVKKIRDTKGIFHAKMGTIKDRNGMDLIEAEDIKKKQQEYTEELYKKDPNDLDNHDGVITHLEPDILNGEVKWALRSLTAKKASGGDEIPGFWQVDTLTFIYFCKIITCFKVRQEHLAFCPGIILPSKCCL